MPTSQHELHPKQYGKYTLMKTNIKGVNIIISQALTINY